MVINRLQKKNEKGQSENGNKLNRKQANLLERNFKTPWSITESLDNRKRHPVLGGEGSPAPRVLLRHFTIQCHQQ